MAVTIVSTPNLVQPIGNGFEFEFAISTSGAGDIQNSIGYWLYDELDQIIVGDSDPEQIPYLATDVPVDFKNDIRPHIFTTIQQPSDSPMLLHDPNYDGQFYMIYGQIEFDSANCTTQTSGVNLDSKSIADYMAINAAFEWYEDYALLSSGDTFVMSDLPVGVSLNLMQVANEVALDQQIYLTIYRKPGGGNIRVSRSSFDSGGNLLFSDITTVATSGAHIYDASPINDIYTSQEVATYRVDVRQDTNTPVQVYDFQVAQCGDAPIRELHWIEPKGSQSSMVFENVIMGGNQSARTVYEQSLPSGLTIPERGKGYGITRADVRAFKRITFQRTINAIPGIEKWLDGLYASDEHYVKFPLPGGTYTMCKFILEDSSYESYNEEQLLVTVVGTLHLPINNL